MGTFPIPILPDAPWRHLQNSRQAHFGGVRNHGYPPHGACDLIVPAGTKVLAVQDGEIIRGPYPFLHIHDKESGCESQTYAIDVKHLTFIARYGEIARDLPKGLDRKNIQEGEVIAEVGIQCGGSMLHFEMFQDTTRVHEGLTNKSHDTKYLYVPQRDYERRNDLLDPTPYLDAWSWDLRVKLGQTMTLRFDMDPDPPPKRAGKKR